jgi:hypothetical protein
MREMTRAYRKWPALQITGRYCERARTIGKGHLQPRSPTWCSIPTTAETERPHTVDATVHAARSGRPGTSPRPPAVPGSGRSKTLEMKMRRLLAALFSTAISMGAAADDDPLTGKLTKDQIEAITIITIARVAGS